MDLTDPEYALAWPREVFVAEANAMMKAERERTSFRANYELLLEEAFVGKAPMMDYSASPKSTFARRPQPDPWDDPWSTKTTPDIPIVSELVRRADELVHPRARRPYFSRRNGTAPATDPRPPGEPDWASAKVRFSEFITRWQAIGYFGEVYPDGCDDVRSDLIVSLDEKLTDLYGEQPPPLRHSETDGWSDEELCDLVELLHDLAARPRDRWYHDYEDHFHYSDHSIRTGQMLYRIRVNDLLAAANLRFRLASDGEDVGRLVTITDDSRAELLVRVAEQPTNRLTDQVGHAIALYRSRQSTREDKISAIRELMAVLEPDRYTVLKGTAAEKDNESLFLIANRYAIRHNKDDQLRDYNHAFLDWVFWAALAMVQLCKEMKAESAAQRT
ncbi:hypothetical protein CJ179_48190 [Rhodococcus sp. ACS1]|uniref:hypothetical protein n=1 Tax=Rhodococcus sp. ACS1 TaxID=2028570 RepID=UPI000BB12159|nr:hypothetical protein [Rhodococcus sp. ACS1]PBC35384.1 hypothetical protein CJ179_48190 [Rhodococcus sp. ACS1]